MPRSSVQVNVEGGAAEGIDASRRASGFTAAPSAQPGSRREGRFESNDVGAEQGPLSNRMQKVFSRDTRTDPGVEFREIVVKTGRDEERTSARDAYVKESRRIAEGLSGRVTVTKQGAVQRRDERGRIREVVRPGFRGAQGQFSAPQEEVRETRPVVVDRGEFKAGVNRRIGGMGRSLFQDPAGLSRSRERAMQAGFLRDRQRRGVLGLPEDLDE